jgi:hypothetical protein
LHTLFSFMRDHFSFCLLTGPVLDPVGTPQARTKISNRDALNRLVWRTSCFALVFARMQTHRFPRDGGAFRTLKNRVFSNLDRQTASTHPKFRTETLPTDMLFTLWCVVGVMSAFR